MKMIKLGLLGGAAFAVMAVGAQADDLSTLKAEIEALNARVAQLETTPAAPAGYSLMTYSKGDATVVPGNNFDYKLLKGYSDKANVFGILPTADAPPSTTIEWSGYVYAIIQHTDYDYSYAEDDTSQYSDYVTNVVTRAQLRVVGKTDTAVGEVGVRVQLRSSGPGVEGDRAFFANEYWGWWAMTPELTFAGGYSSSLGQISYGMDGACNCWYTDFFSSSSSSYRNGSFDGSYDPGDAPQVRLTWGSGPLSLAVALEDSSATGDLSGRGRNYFGDDLAVAGQISYTGDVINGEISAIAYEAEQIQDVAGGGGTDDDGYQVGAGVGFGLGTIANLSLAAAVGDEPRRGDYWGVSGLISFTLTDTIGFEVGANWKDWDDYSGDTDLLEVLAGIYYNPVSQLTFGLEAEYADLPQDVPSGFSRLGVDTSDTPTFAFDGDDLLTFDFVSIWRF